MLHLPQEVLSCRPALIMSNCRNSIGTELMCFCLRQDEESGEIAFYMKGADVVMHNVVQYNDWMDEEVS